MLFSRTFSKNVANPSILSCDHLKLTFIIVEINKPAYRRINVRLDRGPTFLTIYTGIVYKLTKKPLAVAVNSGLHPTRNCTKPSIGQLLGT